MTQYHLRIAASADDLARQVAEQVAAQIDLALAQRDRAQIALAGGETPRASYVRLGGVHLPWERVDVLLGDERWVSANDPASNAGMLRDTLLAQVPARNAAFHPVPTDEANPEAGAEAYARVLRDLGSGPLPCFDVILLGLGDDGHTASLFPGSAALTERKRSVCVSEGKGMPRITLTAPVLSAARQVIFLVSGAGKRQALERLLDPGEPSERTPARLVQPLREVLILADAEAASGLPERVSA
ncbi:MAG: 6-phosphogluconolactonase [Synechococcaceae cyanobacterium]|nr:6-phosphogluconolactonase [Synechococcaceae cyanobacterium]